MKLTLTLDEVSTCAMALLSKAQEAEEEALGCEKLHLLPVQSLVENLRVKNSSSTTLIL
nr:MAG TPA: hypothetical protein [Caudoviricetes sp.]